MPEFDDGQGNFHGPIIEHVNFRDVTPSGNSALIIWIYRFTRWTARKVYSGHGGVGLQFDSGPVTERGDDS